MQEVRAGLMGFQREVEAVRDVLVQKETEIRVLLGERREVRDKMELGRALVDWEDRIHMLQEKLSIDIGDEPAGTGGKDQAMEGDDTLSLIHI